MTRSYYPIDPECHLVVERADDNDAADIAIRTREGAGDENLHVVPLDTNQIERLCRALAYTYQAKTGKLPRLPNGPMFIHQDEPQKPKVVERVRTRG